MKWSKEADEAVAKVPFFVRKRVRRRVEEEAERCGSPLVTMEHVQTCKQRFLNKMEDEVRGYEVESCFGSTGCPNRAVVDDALAGRLEELLAAKDYRSFLMQRVTGPLKMHHEFRISISDCPNTCSRPQIADIGVIGANRPRVSGDPCTGCGACVEACREGAIALSENGPAMDFSRCLSCGKCISACPSGTIVEGRKGYRILVGGKLGRHPRLGTELPGIHAAADTVSLVGRCIDFQMLHNREGERFGEVLERTGVETLEKMLGLERD